MTISRRGFIAGLALTGAAVPAAIYAHRELTREEAPETPGEATVDLADAAGQQLADKLRGVWTLRFEGADAGLAGLPREGWNCFSTSPSAGAACVVTWTVPRRCVARPSRVTGWLAICWRPIRSSFTGAW